MEFNSLEYLVFLPVVWLLFWLLNQSKTTWPRNLILLVASYLFYGWWDARFLVLIAISSVSDYGIALWMERSLKRRKGLLFLSLFINLGILFVFKYYDFFISNFYSNILGVTGDENYPLLHVVLPAGISFYTFQTMSYSIDVYRKAIRPCRNFLDFFLFVSFFPQLVAGPIEKASQLLPQLRQKSRFRFAQFRSGIDLIVYGLAKKVLIADQIAPVVQQCFEPGATHAGNFYLWGAILFSIQIYCDFSGYSDIAIGSARLLGIRLQQNFRFPYFSKNPQDFWKRWHISLYNWLRDYLFIPLGGSRVKPSRLLINILIVFALSGLWHGANWTFICWGLYNGLLIILAHKLWKSSNTPALKISFSLLSYLLILVGWIMFRAESMGHFYQYCWAIVRHEWNGIFWPEIEWTSYLVLGFLLIELLLHFKKRWIVRWRKNLILSGLFKAVILYFMYWYASEGVPFIYFQF